MVSYSDFSLSGERAAKAALHRPLLFAANAQCQALWRVPRDQGLAQWKPHITERFQELLVLKELS